jgi:ligand-binding sensor domain-containing protein
MLIFKNHTLNLLRNYIISLLFVVMKCGFLFGQSTPLFIFENFNSEQGLSQNSCYSIAQDSAGFMWFGTQDGLNRFDGRNFKIFLPQHIGAANLPSNYITSLKFYADKNLLLVSTQKGVCTYNPSGDSIEKFSKQFPYAALLDTTPVRKILSFTKNRLWIITMGKGIFFLNNDTKKAKQILNWPETRSIVSAVTLHNNDIIIATNNQLFKAIEKDDEVILQPLLQAYNFSDINSLFSYDNKLWIGTLYNGCFIVNNILDAGSITKAPKNLNGIGPFITDINNNLLIGTRGYGLFRFLHSQNKWEVSTNNPLYNNTIAKNFILSLFRDKQGIIWCGMSGGGVAKYDPTTFRFYTIGSGAYGDSLGLPDNMVLDIYNSGNGKFYIGTQNKGLLELDEKKKSVFSFTGSSVLGNVNNIIYDITSDSKNYIWVAGWAGLMKVNTRNRSFKLMDGGKIIESKKLYCLHKLKKKDSLFIAGEYGPIFFSLKDEQWKFCPPEIQKTNINPGRYLYEGDDGILWICSSGAGLIKYDYQNNRIDPVLVINKKSVNVRHLYPDKDIFWLSTDIGVLVYDVKANKVIKHIVLKENNSSNVCYAIQKDKAGFFWVSSNIGLLRINPKDYSVIPYDRNNGLQFLEFNTAAASKTDNGLLYFGGVGGIAWFNPVGVTQQTYAPPAIISMLDVNQQLFISNTTLLNNTKVNLKYKENFIRLQFCVTNFSNQLKNSFAYKLSGIDNDWVYSGTQDFANYTNLAPGMYEFQLKAANSDGVWSKEITTLTIVIERPWWQRWWFWLSILMLASLITIYIVRNRIKFIRKQASLKHQIAEAEMQALRAQMNPHFIFNSLNAINRYILKSDKASASAYLTKFSKLIRRVLDNSRQQKIPLSQEIEALELYLEMESLRFQQNFNWKIKLDEDISTTALFIPPMTIQPFVENAIWHGLLPKQGDCELKVSFVAQSNNLSCVVEDNGVGRKKSALLKQDSIINKSSLGISATEQRLKLITQGDSNVSNVEIEDLYDDNGHANGTRVTINIPYLYT